MIRYGGIGYSIDPRKPFGQRISEMVLLKTGQRIEITKDYGRKLGCAADPVDGPPIWDLFERNIARKKIVGAAPASAISVVNRCMRPGRKAFCFVTSKPPSRNEMQTSARVGIPPVVPILLNVLARAQITHFLQDLMQIWYSVLHAGPA